MQAFNYKKVGSANEALKINSSGHARFLAGGTTLIDLMKLEVETPRNLIDLAALPYAQIEVNKSGVKIGALVKNSELAHHEVISKQYSVLSQALLAGASTQLRNKATTGGNLLQRTRCVYFRDPTKACNKREPGSGCSAIEGHNRNLAILGTSEKCIANNPSDMNVALQALEARIHLLSEKGMREVPMIDFHLLPGETPQIETVLRPNEMITHVSLPTLPVNTKTLYVKLRDRASYEFALASAAVVTTVDKGGNIERVRLAMGGIGAKPWRSVTAEKMLEGQKASESLYKAAAEEFLKGARPQSQNGFKVELAKRCLVHALKIVMPV